MPNYVLIGAAGYVAPKHMKAIKDTGGDLIACTDPHDSVGILDSYFPKCQYFNEWERFDRFCNNRRVDYVVICSPNYLHETHARWGLKLGADVICEKPLALYKRNLDNIRRTETKTGNKVNVILQLRLMDRLKELRNSMDTNCRVSLEYITPRGYWYNYSWKGDETKSGGLATNIGIHLFDLMTWIFGNCYEINLEIKNDFIVSGNLVMNKGQVDFLLSINGNKPKRMMSVNGSEVDFNNGFTDLHTKSYEQILSGDGFGIDDAFPSIAICEAIREIKIG